MWPGVRAGAPKHHFSCFPDCLARGVHFTLPPRVYNCTRLRSRCPHLRMASSLSSSILYSIKNKQTNASGLTHYFVCHPPMARTCHLKHTALEQGEGTAGAASDEGDEDRSAYLERKRCPSVNILGMRLVGCTKAAELTGALYPVPGLRGFPGPLHPKTGYCALTKHARSREGAGTKLVNSHFTSASSSSSGSGLTSGRGHARAGHWFRHRPI